MPRSKEMQLLPQYVVLMFLSVQRRRSCRILLGNGANLLLGLVGLRERELLKCASTGPARSSAHLFVMSSLIQGRAPFPLWSLRVYARRPPLQGLLFPIASPLMMSCSEPRAY
ncbi:hypothetical protein SKAU_G00013790 [Synaphobranchus kaupii]|uniref:Uncharacterized protein n=1 Tax=Synaphobranchus kaupii TaxID=118154 RepID=A0A9Q1GBP9_SYNKA|nr:hypothetical protein SKAU_G00013790 [Synaphobranchus kaupii]